MFGRTWTAEQLRSMSLEDALVEIGAAVYRATYLIEALESVGKVRGNGHQARQVVAAYAGEELRQRWKDSQK